MDIVAYILAKKYADKLVAGLGVFCGYVEPGGSMPTTRSDGAPLKNDDYVKPKASSTFPFTIGSLTFESRLSKAFYYNGEWLIDPGVIQETNEVPVNSPVNESLSEEAATQKAINIETKKAIIDLQELHKPEMEIKLAKDLFNTGETASVHVICKVKKTLKKIKAIALMRDSVVLRNYTVGVEEGLNFTYEDAITLDCDYSIRVTDEDDKIFNSEKVDVVFLDASYYGYASDMSTMTKIPLQKEKITEVKYTCDFDQPVFKWPTSRGRLTSILAATDGNYYENYLSSFNMVSEGGYYVYTLKDKCYLKDYTFSFIKEDII